MDLIESIRIFRRVAERESFSAVATEFNVTQPTISKAVAALEENLGVDLFRRSTRGLALTSAGQKLLHSSRSVVEQLDEIISAVKNEKFLLQGQLRITASLAFARLILAPLFEEFTDRHPLFKFHFLLSDGYVDLVENNIDFAIRIGHLPDSSLKAFKIGQSKRSFYASKKYIKKFGQPQKIEDLKKHRLLFYTGIADRPSLPLVDENNKKIDYQFEPHLQSDGSDLIRQAVLENVGIAFLPNWMMIGTEYEKMILPELERFIGPPAPIYLVSTGGLEMTAKQRAFADFLRLKFEKIPALRLRG